MIVETCLGVLHPSFTACLVWVGVIRTKDELFILSQSYHVAQSLIAFVRVLAKSAGHVLFTPCDIWRLSLGPCSV